MSVLRELAKSRNLKGVSALRKEALIERMLEEDEKAGSTEKNAAGIEKNAGDADKDRASERTVDSPWKRTGVKNRSLLRKEKDTGSARRISGSVLREENM